MPEDRLRPLGLLLVEDSEADAGLLVLELRRRGFLPRVHRVATHTDLVDALSLDGWDLVISDHNLPGFGGAEALRVVKERRPDLPFIVVSGSIGEDYAVEVMRNGADDFVLKDRLHRLVPAVERELREAEQRIEQRRMAAALADSEERLRQSQKLEAIGRLAGGIAHDFNNLLTAIIGYSNLTLRGLPPDHPTRPDIEEVKRAGERAVDLTRQLLAFSRQQVLRATVLDLNEVLTSVTRLLRRVIGDDVVLNVEAATDLWPVKADRTQLEQIVMNLAVNARHAMDVGGILTITTRNLVVAHTNQPNLPTRAGRYVVLEVSDTGAGIPEDVIPKIFEPFFTTKPKGEGTGLGLATVYGIVKQSEGFIYVSSAVGVGTIFTIYFPETTETAVPLMAPPLPVARTGHETILIVEDQAIVRDLTARVLRAAGYHVLIAANAAAAIRIAADPTQSVDLLLTDVVMPGMSGPELARRLLTSRPDLRVILMSGFNGQTGDDPDPSDIHDRFALIEKPFTPERLVQQVAAVLSRVRS